MRFHMSSSLFGAVNVLLVLCVYCATAYTSYLSESWAMLSGRPTEPRCVPIPRNFSLCYGIDYTRMRLPNLLEHETMQEVTEQAASWVPLWKVNCHPDTQLFFCSLFAPVCLDRTIYPCRSLCEAVKQGCENRMKLYGFAWPEMLNCDKFPVATDMCIQPRAIYENQNQNCNSCNQVGTYENILDNFCRSTHVMKVKMNKVEPSFVRVQRGRAVKPVGLGDAELKGVRLLYSEDESRSCQCDIAESRRQTRKPYLVMANKARGNNGDYVMNLILPWKKEKQFKRAVRMFKTLDCTSIGNTIRERARRERTRRFKKQRQEDADGARWRIESEILRY